MNVTSNVAIVCCISHISWHAVGEEGQEKQSLAPLQMSSTSL